MDLLSNFKRILKAAYSTVFTDAKSVEGGMVEVKISYRAFRVPYSTDDQVMLAALRILLEEAGFKAPREDAKIKGFTVPSIFDPKDFIYEEMLSDKPKLPWAHDITGWTSHIPNQENSPICVPVSAALCKEWQEYRSSVSKIFRPSLSAEFIYTMRSDKSREGMSVKEALQILYTQGIPEEKQYQPISGRWPEPSPEVQKNASLYKIKAFARIETVEGMKISIMKNGPCMMVLPLRSNGEKFWLGTGYTGQLGSHCVTVEGWNLNSFIFRNSWGQGWGDDGFGYFPFREWANLVEAWTLVDEDPKVIMTAR